MCLTEQQACLVKLAIVNSSRISLVRCGIVGSKYKLESNKRQTGKLGSGLFAV